MLESLTTSVNQFFAYQCEPKTEPEHQNSYNGYGYADGNGDGDGDGDYQYADDGIYFLLMFILHTY